MTVSGSYAGHAIEQTTRGTIGDGIALTVTDKKQSTPEDTINRDTTQAQVITKNQSAGVQVYASTNAVKEISTGFEGIRNNFQELPKVLSNVPQNVLDIVDKTAKTLDLTDKTPTQGAKALADALVANGTIKAGQKPTVDAVIDAWADPAVREAVTACAGTGQQGFNLHDLIFTPAYAAGCGPMIIGGKTLTITKDGAQQAILCLTGAVASGAAGKSLGVALRFMSGPVGLALQEILKSDPTGGEFTKSYKTDGVLVTLQGYGSDSYATMVVNDGAVETSYVIQKQAGGVFVPVGATIATPDGGKRPLTDTEFAVLLSSQANALAGAGLILPSKPGKMLGENGAKLNSKTVWQNEKGGRLDVENPNPGQRPGQVHYQEGGKTYYYDPDTKKFIDAPRYVNDLLKDGKFQNAVQKALKYLGE